MKKPKNIDVLIFAIFVGIIAWYFNETFVYHFYDTVGHLPFFNNPNISPVWLEIPRLVVIVGDSLQFLCIYLVGYNHDKIKKFLYSFGKKFVDVDI